MSELAHELNKEVRMLVGALCVDKLELQIALAQARAEIDKLKAEKKDPDAVLG
jgi:uncharacterized small protein (DUF1192 family)